MIVMGVVAFHVGPPEANVVATPAATGPTTIADPPVQPVVGSDLMTGLAGATVSSFGPVPGCDDQVAISTVLGLLRKASYERLLGLANVHAASGGAADRPAVWECEADTQGGRGQMHVNYRISQAAAGQQSWQITILSAADARTVIPASAAPQ